MNLGDVLKTKAGQDPRNRAALEEAARAPGPKHGAAQPVAGLGDPERKHLPVQALVESAPDKPRRKARVVICVEIIRFGRKEFDEDNLVAGAKPLRDSIARGLGVDDGDKRLRWRYSQVVTECSGGTLVRIERLK